MIYKVQEMVERLHMRYDCDVTGLPTAAGVMMLDAADLLCELRDELAAARAEVEQARQYAHDLAVAMHRHSYEHVPQWQPLPDLLGLITQIDNMAAGRRQDKP
jgi:hypothetical protein